MSDNETNDYYELLKQENYKALLNKEVQAANAKDQALKYTQNTMRASGMGTQGLSESTNAGIYNNYQGAINQAKTDFSTQNNEIEMQRIQAVKDENNSNFQGLTTLISNAQSGSDLNNIMTRYGITVDKDGTLSGEYFSSLDTNSQKQLQVYYDMTSGQLNSDQKFIDDAITDQTGYTNYESLLKHVKTEGDKSAESYLSSEIYYITNNSEFVSSLTNGKVVCLQHKNNDANKLYLIFNNGAWYKTNATVYNNATNKEFISK